MKLLLTRELGRLATWLRILGFDAEYSRQNNNSSVIIQALREGRVILTRNHRMPASRGIKIVVLKEEKIKQQLAEALRLLQVAADSRAMFSRCTVCNEALTSIAKEEVRDKVPEYVFQTQTGFFACLRCNRVYWHGTHWGNASRLIEEIKG